MYKVVYKNTITIDLIKSPQYVRWMNRGKKFVKTDIISANGIRSSDYHNVYHVIGMPNFDGMESYKSVELIKIDKDEYNYLCSLITKGEPLDVDLINTRKNKIAEMSQMSENIIHKGMDITLSDGKTYHFSFSDQDQYQIGFLATSAKTAQMLETMGLPTNETGKDYPWHADGGDCIFYSRQDMITIGTAMQNYITYHNSYFHALRNYINEMNNPLKILEIQYGVEIPRMYCGDVYTAVTGA